MLFTCMDEFGATMISTEWLQLKNINVALPLKIHPQLPTSNSNVLQTCLLFSLCNIYFNHFARKYGFSK